jgi:uncharacterized membrane protein YeiB
VLICPGNEMLAYLTLKLVTIWPITAFSTIDRMALSNHATTTIFTLFFTEYTVDSTPN